MSDDGQDEDDDVRPPPEAPQELSLLEKLTGRLRVAGHACNILGSNRNASADKA